MLTLLNVSQLALPLEDPVLKFLVVLIIILSAPLLLNKIKVPHLLGLIIAGAVIGPNGFNVLARDSSIVVTGTTGLLYIMFLAGLEIDLVEFKKNKWKSVTFGLYTFAIPFVLGILSSHFLFNFSWLTAIVFASIFSSHTLISYPIVSKMGIVKTLPVNLTVGGTMITDVLALLVLAVCVGMTQGEINNAFWIKLSVSMVVFSAVVLFGFPILGRWFFKKVRDSISQYIFVLVMIYLAAVLAELAGVEAIIGAFFAGLALNRLIPRASALMNRVEFVGNAIFIPFFLISVGMIIDFSVFFKDWKTIEVAVLMTIIAIGAKYIAAVATQKTFKLSKEDAGVIFGLSTAHAAATLAIVMVGYSIILGETDSGEPIRLLDENILNGSILLILVSCTVSSFVTQKNSEKLLKKENENTAAEAATETENILIALNHPNTVEALANLGLLIKSKKTERLFALNVINEDEDDSSKKHAEKVLEEIVKIGAAADLQIVPLMRFDKNLIEGVRNEIRANSITDLLLGVEPEKGFSASFIHHLYSGYLKNTGADVFVYQAVQPAATVQKYMVVIPENAAKEPRFFHSLLKVWNIARNSGSKVEFYGDDATIKMIQRIQKNANIDASFIIFSNWDDLPKVLAKMKENDALMIFMAQYGMPSYQDQMQQIPNLLSEGCKDKNFLLLFPGRANEMEYKKEVRNISNASDFIEISQLVRKLFK